METSYCSKFIFDSNCLAKLTYSQKNKIISITHDNGNFDAVWP